MKALQILSRHTGVLNLTSTIRAVMRCYKPQFESIALTYGALCFESPPLQPDDSSYSLSEKGGGWAHSHWAC